MFSAVVFAYSEVGFRCLRELLDAGVRVPLVFTHEDRPGETQWFQSVERLARERGVEVVTAADPNIEPWIERLARIAPEYVFAFYYRSMLAERLLATARWGALNMHGSLLPKYRGRAPINWAILQGETETGATLHYMVRKPDAGPIVASEAVPIGSDDTALTVSMAVAEAAAHLLRALPAAACRGSAGCDADESRSGLVLRRSHCGGWTHRLGLACGTRARAHSGGGSAIPWRLHGSRRSAPALRTLTVDGRGSRASGCCALPVRGRRWPPAC